MDHGLRRKSGLQDSPTIECLRTAGLVRDLIDSAGGIDFNDDFSNICRSHTFHGLANMLVREVMNLNAVRISLNSTMRQAADLLCNTQASDLMAVAQGKRRIRERKSLDDERRDDQAGAARCQTP